MSLQSDLKARVANVSAITDILGTSPIRFRWSNVPQGESAPYTRYFRVSRDRKRGHDGAAGLTLARVQMEHYAEDPDDAVSLADAFTANLDTANNGTVTLLLMNETDEFQVDALLFQVTQEWQVQWRES